MAHPKNEQRGKAKFRVGQVVAISGVADDPTEYGIVAGFDDGRWHLVVGGRWKKVLEDCLRPLTAREKGQP